MKALFVFDNKFIPLNGNVYSDVMFPSSAWDRYLSVFDSLIVIGRQGECIPGKDISSYVVSSAPKVSFIFAPNMSSITAQILKRKKATQLLKQYIQQTDAVIVRLQSELGLLAIQEAKKMNKPWAVEMVGCPFDALWNYGSLTAKAYAPVLALRTRKAVAESPFVLYVTHEFLQKRYPNNSGITDVCSNVVIPKPDRDVLENRLASIDRNDGKLVLGLIGTLRNRYKGIQTVLSILQSIRDYVPEITFRVLGDGDVTPWIREAKKHRVDDIVSFDGTLPPGKEVLAWLDGIDLYVQPSLQEGLPRALIEAMSRGCPAVGSQCAGIPELLDESCLFPPGKGKRLKQLIIEKVQDNSWKKTQAEKNWKRAKEYSEEILEKKRYNFWKRYASSLERE